MPWKKRRRNPWRISQSAWTTSDCNCCNEERKNRWNLHIHPSCWRRQLKDLQSNRTASMWTAHWAGQDIPATLQRALNRLIGIDQDAEAIEAATKRLEPWQEHVTLVRDNYCNLPAVLNSLGIDKVDGIMLDLGVSSISWTTPREDFPIVMIPHWICGWISVRP